MADELDALVLEGHGGALNPEAGDGTEDFERRHAALQDRLKCDVITVAEEVAKEKACRVSPQLAQQLQVRVDFPRPVPTPRRDPPSTPPMGKVKFKRGVGDGSSSPIAHRPPPPT